MRTSWRDAIAACPPILITLAFKIFVLRPYATRFKYFVPSPEELVDLARESQRSYKQRFIHPALGNDTLYTIMVHKEQQELVRMILAPYSRKLQSEVAGVREVRGSLQAPRYDWRSMTLMEIRGHLSRKTWPNTTRSLTRLFISRMPSPTLTNSRAASAATTTRSYRHQLTRAVSRGLTPISLARQATMRARMSPKLILSTRQHLWLARMVATTAVSSLST